MKRNLSKNKQRIFTVILVIGSTVFALLLAEFALSYYRQYVTGSDRQDPHMIVYDDILGWKLASNWSGRHRHYDFDVRYETNEYGFRGAFPERKDSGDRVLAVVGDSFTFSYGVDEGETFIDLLNTAGRDDGDLYYNFGVPGYSTDQELLLIQERVLGFDPDVIYLVVYLFNDLIDNGRAYPIQSAHAKPYFDATPSGLKLRNVPVPMSPVEAELRHNDIGSLLLGDEARDTGIVARFLKRFELTRQLAPLFEETPDIRSQLEQGLTDSLALFDAIIDQIHRECAQRGIELRLVLMPGRSFVEQSGSLSARYQDFLREKIPEITNQRDIVVLDLATYLKDRYEENGTRLYHPNEGHLNTDGHAAVAEFLRGQVNNDSGNDPI